MIGRHSTRSGGGLGPSWLATALVGAASYDRIAGYFRSSILEFAEEGYAAVAGRVRVVCNADLDPRDITSAKAAATGLRRNWNAEPHPIDAPGARTRYERLADLLATGRFEVWVLPQRALGLVHGKAGVIRYTDGRVRAFLGSGNETRQGFTDNYELLWEDDSPAAADWVQAEFDALLAHPDIRRLDDAVREAVESTLRTRRVPLAAWEPAKAPGAPFAESPLERVGVGLMPHQKSFAGQVVRDATVFGGAHFILADEVGLGKTIQLGMAAALLSLQRREPALILTPKNVAMPFSGDLWNLLGLPNAVWTGDAWITEDERATPGEIDAAPRQLVIVPTSRILADTAEIPRLLEREWACVVLDEAHRARTNQTARAAGSANSLRRFLEKLARKTPSLLLGTATPVQLDPQELWDLLDLLQISAAAGTDRGRVLGTPQAKWRDSAAALRVAAGERIPDDTAITCFQWLCDPLPPRWEAPGDRSRVLADIWRALGDLPPATWHVHPRDIDKMHPGIQHDIRRNAAEIVRHHNPIIRHVIKRTRDGLAQNPAMAGYHRLLRRIEVDTRDIALRMDAAIADAYEAARAFGKVIARRTRGAGILQTLLLRRVSSSLAAGRRTVDKLRAARADTEGESEDLSPSTVALSPSERAALEAARDALDACQMEDPKLDAIRQALKAEAEGGDGFQDRGCILFSMYFDTVAWLADQLSAEQPGLPIGVYGGGTRSFILEAGGRVPVSREALVKRIAARTVRVLVATDSASEGLNLQELSAVINVDLPWNPARLEQRVGRVKRIGQAADRVKVLNLRYEGSVEDEVHQRLSERLQDVHRIFGDIPDHLEDVWVEAALSGIEEAAQQLFKVQARPPFAARYDDTVDTRDWDQATQTVALAQVQEALLQPAVPRPPRRA